MQWTQCDSALVRPYLRKARGDILSDDALFDEDETAALRELADTHRGHNWEQVAAELASRGFHGRTAMGCFRYFKCVLDGKREDALVVRTAGPSNKWTPEEDALLRKAVDDIGCGDWVAVATRVAGKSNEQCLQRWTFSLDPAIIKGKLTSEEDARLMQLVARHGAKNWSKWAHEMRGRTGPQNRERWFDRLDPERKQNNDPWTAEEELALLREVSICGAGMWSAITRGARLEPRTDAQVRDHYRRMVRPLDEADVQRLQDSPDELLELVEAARARIEAEN